MFQCVLLTKLILGQFNGIDAIKRAWESGRQGKLTKTGIMIHYVISMYNISALILSLISSAAPHPFHFDSVTKKKQEK